MIDQSVLDKKERITFGLRSLYMSYGYKNYRMNKFEEYDLYAQNKDFLVSDNVITFTDTDGKLLALKPDVTLSIIKNDKDDPTTTRKLCYNENVYRVSKGSGCFKEILQVGVECVGAVDAEATFETLTLAAESLRLISEEYALTLSSLDVLEKAVAQAGLGKKEEKELYLAISGKNTERVAALCGEGLLTALLSLNGALKDVYPRLNEIAKKYDAQDVYADFAALLQKVLQSAYADKITVDFSIVGDINYYNGVVFKGFIQGVPTEVLSGGQYDNLLKKLKRKSRAVGFAVYTDELESDFEDTPSDDYVNVALPKGRLGEKAYQALADIGYECPSILEPNRKLVFENPEKKVRYFWVKPSDIAIYVERGAADVGIAGKDILDEYAPDVYELADLKMGKCKMAVAAPLGFTDDPTKTLRVATKFSSIARNYYQSKGRNIDIIHLNGSIEIAPLLGLSDVIVDIVETGRTLKENNLVVIEEIENISARLIANKASFTFKKESIVALCDKLPR